MTELKVRGNTFNNFMIIIIMSFKLIKNSVGNIN